MSERRIRLSRRSILQITGLAPFAMLAVAGHSTQARAVSMFGFKPIPGPTMDELVAEAEKKDPNLNKMQFREVVEHLWAYCRAGARYAGLEMPEPDKDDAGKNEPHRKLIKDAYKVRSADGFMCGDLIVSKLADWGDLREVTNVCAFDCGYNASWAARDLGKNAIETDAYTLGYRQTERKMKKTMFRVRMRHQGMGTPPPPFRGGGC